MRTTAESPLMASVIVPVYNKAEYVADCIASLEGQTIDKDDFEVVIVDDGSSDNSLSVCRSLAESSPLQIAVVAKENGGVSSARNAGMMQAKGKYLFFLDSDDSYSPNTLQSVVDVFEGLGDACDVVTYPLRYYYPATGKTRGHERQKWFSESGLYPLADYPFLAQSTMNVCVRNRFDENILFSSELKMGEDQLFVSRNLQRKAALGYCADAQYTYTRDGGNSSALGNRPCNAFDDMILLYDSLLAIAKETPSMAEYARQLILYNFNWRLRASMLFPDFCSGDQLALEEGRLSSVFERIDSSSVIDSPYLGELHKVFLLSRYRRFTDSPIVRNGDETCLRLVDGSEFPCSGVRMIVTRCRKTANKRIALSGRLVYAPFLFEGAPKMRLVNARGSIDVLLTNSSYDYAGTRIPITKCWGFDLELPLSSGRIDYDVEIELADGTKVVPEISKSISLHDVRMIKGFAYAEGHRISFDEGTICVDGSPLANGCRALFYDLLHPDVVPARLALRWDMFRSRSRRIWLYQDLSSSPVKGDALRQFLHDSAKEDGIERYYVTACVDELVAAHPAIADHVVKPRSSRHKFLYAASELILASYLERGTFTPYSKKGVNRLGDLFRPKKYVYLQHGILHAHIPWYFSKDRILFDYEVVSTAFEVTNLTQNYCFDDASLIKSGAARLDDAEFGSADFVAKRIIYAPSWRSYLVGGKSEERVGDDASLVSSNMWKGMKAFLAGVAESGMLEKYGYTLDVKLHPNFACYKHLFDFGDSRIRLADDNVDESSYAVMITDFSSMVYDFVYTGARIMYFVPDSTEFACGFNHYSKLDLPFSEGFGPYSETAAEAISSLEGILVSLSEGEPDAYANRRNGFFLHTDSNNRERLYCATHSVANAEVEASA